MAAKTAAAAAAGEKAAPAFNSVNGMAACAPVCAQQNGGVAAKAQLASRMRGEEDR
jgi:hypothetical protein